MTDLGNVINLTKAKQSLTEAQRKKRGQREKRNKGEDVNDTNKYQLVNVSHQQLRPERTRLLSS